MALDIPVLDSIDFDTPVGTHTIPADIFALIGNDGLHTFVREFRRRYQAKGHIIKLYINELKGGVHLSWMAARPGSTGDILDYRSDAHAQETDARERVLSSIPDDLYLMTKGTYVISKENFARLWDLRIEVISRIIGKHFASHDCKVSIGLLPYKDGTLILEWEPLLEPAIHVPEWETQITRRRPVPQQNQEFLEPIESYEPSEIEKFVQRYKDVFLRQLTGAIAITMETWTSFGCETVGDVEDLMTDALKQIGRDVTLTTHSIAGGMEIRWKPFERKPETYHIKLGETVIMYPGDTIVWDDPNIEETDVDRVTLTTPQRNIFSEAMQNIDFDNSEGDYVIHSDDARLLTEPAINDFKLGIINRFKEEGFVVRVFHGVGRDGSIHLMWTLIENLKAIDEMLEGTSKTASTTGKDIDPNGVNHPAHYNSHPSGIEAIDIIRYFRFNVGNAIKYCWRAGLKTTEGEALDMEIKDLEKAVFYLNDEIAELKRQKARADG